MVEEKRVRGRPFGPNNPPPGRGRPKLSPENKGARRLNLDEFLTICDKYMAMTLPQLQAAVKDPTIPMKEMMVAVVIGQGVKKGDPRQFDFVLERYIGKAPMKVINEHSGPGGAPIPVSSQRLDYSRLTKEEVETLERIVKKAIVEA